MLNELVAVLVQELVCGADRAVGDTSHDADLFRALWLAKQMARHVDTRRGNRQRRATCKISNVGDLGSKTLADLDKDLLVKTELRAETSDEIDCVCRRRWLV